ncbi:MAG: outer membrane protein assembly factor BamA [Microgenomates group bacterium]
MAHRLVRPTVLAVLLSTAMVSGAFFTPAIAQTYSFSNVVIEGNTRVDAVTILKFAGIGRNEKVNAGQLNDAYQRIVAAGLFETVALEPNGNTLVIKVTEFPMLNVVDYQGNKRLKDEELIAATKSRSRLVFSPKQAEEDAASIAEIYRIKGRLAASVVPKVIRRSDNRVDLVFEISEGKVVENERLSFVGNRAFSDRRLRQVLETKQAGFLRQVIGGDTFVAERLDLDKQLLKDFYLSRGFVDVQILDATGELTRERDATFVTFTLREGLSYKIGNVTTISEIDGVDAAEFNKQVKLRTGVTYSPAVIENNIARLETLALRKGLNFVRVEPRLVRDERTQTLNVEFVLSRGERVFVERIDIEGNTTTLDQVVRRQFNSAEGDPFNPREIRQAAERIRALGYFVDAQVNAEPGTDPGNVVVNVDVEEAPTGSISFGASYGVSQGFGISLGFSETNFLGRGQSLSVNISSGTSNVDSSINFVEPAFLGRDLKLKFGAFYKETTKSNAFYDTRNIAISPAIEFPISQNGRLELRYKVAMDTVLNVDPGSSPLIAADAALGGVLTNAIGYSYTYDSRIGGLDPTGTVLLRFEQDFVASDGSSASFLSSKALAVLEKKVFNEDVTLRTIFEGGLLNSSGGSTRITDRFFGNGKIRGFEPNGIGPRDTSTNKDALGGNAFAVMRFEADFPLGLPEEYGITGGAFMDVGSVWSLDNTAGTGTIDDSARVRSVVGLSVLWGTPLGPLRFNFSKALQKETYDKEQTFDLTISTKF